MVLAERNSENVRNGRRSRGPSPNGHVGGAITESSSDDENSKKNGNASTTKKKSEYEEKIRVGRDYQVVCPELIPPADRKPEQLNDRALLVWSPTKEIPDSKLEEYITVAKDKYGYNGEQALGMLFWHKHDLERAVMDLANFTPFPDEWTVEDKVLFEQAFQFHGKSFHRIRQMLPDKSIASLVKFYYSWKKTRSRTSVMDRQEKKQKDSSENGSENGSNEESDNEEKKWPYVHRGLIRRSSCSPPPNASTSPTAQAQSAANAPNANDSSDSKTNLTNNTGTPTTTNNSNNCTGCGVTCNELNNTPMGNLCGSCYHHFRRTGQLRPTCGPIFVGKRTRGSSNMGKSGDRTKRKPPRGMYINHDDIVKLANQAQNPTNTPNEDLLASMDREIVSLWSQIQLNKQTVSALSQKTIDLTVDSEPTESPNVRINSRWINEELLLAVQGVRKYGKNFQAIAEMLGTKTEAQVRTFFVNYRRRYNLDNVLKEFEAEQQNEITPNDSEDNPSRQVNGGVKTNNNGTVNSNNTKNGGQDSEIMEVDLVEDETMVNGKNSSNIKDISPEGIKISSQTTLHPTKLSTAQMTSDKASTESVNNKMEVDENDTNTNNLSANEPVMIK